MWSAAAYSMRHPLMTLWFFALASSVSTAALPASLSATLAHGKRLLKQSPWDAIAFLEVECDAGAFVGDDAARARIMNELADVQRFAKEFRAARRWRRRALKLQMQELRFALERRSPRSSEAALELALTQSSLAADMYFGGQPSRAIKTLQTALRQPGLSSVAAAVLTRAASAAHECDGDAVLALLKFEEASKAVAESGMPRAPSDAVQLMALLRRVVRVAKPPAHVAASMAARGDALAAELLRDGPWERRDQLPKHFVPGLSAAGPWPRLDEDFPQLGPLVALLEVPRAVAALRAEYTALRRDGHMHREWECIHDPSRGAWSRFELAGAWHREESTDAEGCSALTPAACGILRELRALDVVPIFRAGFSAVAAAAWITPHFGVSNAQLKIHLGLIVPKRGRGGLNADLDCAHFTVGNATRTWREGRALLFDDSYRHEVSNDCDEERVVFQVVIGHPKLRERLGSSFGVQHVFDHEL